MLPKVSGYMSFVIEDDELLKNIIKSGMKSAIVLISKN